MAGQWLFSFPPAWRKKRGCFCKKGSCPTKGCDEKANWNQIIPENINGNVTGRCALRSSCRRTRQANALTEPQSRECAKHQPPRNGSDASRSSSSTQAAG